MTVSHNFQLSTRQNYDYFNRTKKYAWTFSASVHSSVRLSIQQNFNKVHQKSEEARLAKTALSHKHSWLLMCWYLLKSAELTRNSFNLAIIWSPISSGPSSDYRDVITCWLGYPVACIRGGVKISTERHSPPQRKVLGENPAYRLTWNRTQNHDNGAASTRLRFTVACQICANIK